MSNIAGINEKTVTPWLATSLETAQPPFTFELIPGGRSNLTYKVTDAAQRAYVLRRPPLGVVLETAHDVIREFRIMAGVGQSDVPVPQTLVACDNPEINGTSFTIVSYVDGVVLHDDTSAAPISAAQRHALGLDVIDVLARLHKVDPDAVGLGQLGRREGYVARQLRRWSRQWEAQKTREVPAMDEVRKQLEATIPQPPCTSIVHGDYRLGNLIVASGAVQAVLDWELCTLGDPLADMGYLLNTWIQPAEATMWDVPPTYAGGFPDRSELISRYAHATGFDLSHIDYYRSFAYWRFAAILEGVRIRHEAGAHGETDVDLAHLATSVVNFADAALALV